MKAWLQFLSDLEQELGADSVDKWVRPLKITKFDAANLYLEVTDPMEASWFEEHVRPRLKNQFFNENHRPIRVHLDTPKSLKKEAAPSQAPSRIESDPIDPSCTLGEFFHFPGNEIAAKLIHNWLSTGKALFNPIFIYGPKGSGKTHLLMGTSIALSKQGKKTFYVKADRFTEHVVQAIRAGRMIEFRNTYRDIDVLLVDDIDRLSGRSATQEEFFHTFNALHMAGKQIMLASRSNPSKLEKIEERLISRFEWGISLQIEKAPTPEIIRRKANCWNIPVNEPLVDYLEAKFATDPILALQALSLRASHSSPLTVLAAEKLLSDLEKAEEKSAITPERIIKSLSAHFGIAPEDLTGKVQSREFVVPRQIAMYLCREKLKLPYQAIGKIFNRDHSTVMSSVKLIGREIENRNAEILAALSAENTGKEY